MKFLSPTGLESQPFKLKKGHRTLLFTIDELEELECDIILSLSAHNIEIARKSGLLIEDAGPAGESR